MESLKIILLIVCLSAFASNCVSLALWIGQSRIIGGRNATSSAEFVYQVSFQHVKNTSLYHYCGGAILTQDWIITAFKCVDSVDINKVRVMYGSHRLTVPGVVVEIEKIIAHPDWNHVTLEHNLVLVKTKKKIEFVPNVIGPIALPEQASEIGDEGLVSGWGVTEKENETYEIYSDQLQYHRTRLSPIDECRALSEPSVVDLVHQSTSVCTINQHGYGICKGDVGTPLVSLSHRLIGVASFIGECAVGKPEIFTAIHPHADWIRSIINAPEQHTHYY